MSKTSTFRPPLRLSALALALSAVAGLAQAQVFDKPAPEFKGMVRATTPLILPGNEVDIAGMGFVPGQKITLQRGSTLLNATPFTVDAEGGFTGKIGIPEDAAIGVHPVVVLADGPDSASIWELKVSRTLPISGEERFDVVSAKLAPGLYQSAYSAKSDVVFVTSAVGRPPVSQSGLLKVSPDSLDILARVTPAQAPAPKPHPGLPAPPAGRGPAPAQGPGVNAVYGVAVNDANGTVWVTNTRQNTVAVYKQSDLSLVKQYPVDAVPHSRDVIVDQARHRAYASATGENTLAVFDTRTLEQLPNIVIDSTVRGEKFVPTSLELDAASGKVFTAGMATNEIAIIDTASGKVDKVFAVAPARGAIGVAYAPEAKRVLVVSQGSDNLLIVDPETGKTVHDVYVGAGALNVAWEPVGQLAWVSNRAAGTVTAIDLDGTIVANLDGGTFPNHVHEDGKGAVFAINKSRGEEDASGDRITRITAKKR